MKDVQGKHHKVYFFTMVLSRSRYKFVYFQYQPFTSSTAIDAHLKAFEFFGGIPEKILYDQDRVFMRDENLGDWLLTGEFSCFARISLLVRYFAERLTPSLKAKPIRVTIGFTFPRCAAVFFDYRYGRSREGPKQLLKNFTGYLQNDG